LLLKKYYDILEIPIHADEATIKAAFRKKAKHFHPDVNKSPNAHQQFLLIQYAYNKLINGNFSRKDIYEKIKQEEKEAERLKREKFMREWVIYKTIKNRQEEEYHRKKAKPYINTFFVLLIILGLYISFVPPIYVLLNYEFQYLSVYVIPLTFFSGLFLSYASWKSIYR
jgi:curved DNA-binding protein CbpA